jgi:electron transfer flavoprotein beta subunit
MRSVRHYHHHKTIIACRVFCFSTKYKSIINFCCLAVEEAVRLRERLKDKVKSITAVTLGPAKAAETLRTALAMGADAAVHIEIPESAPAPEPLGVARALRAVIERRQKQEGGGGGGTDLVIMGKQAIDDDLGQTGQMLAGLWGAAQATCASGVEVDVEKRVVRVRTEVDGGSQELLCSLPAVVTTDLRCVVSLFRFAPKTESYQKRLNGVLVVSSLGSSFFNWDKNRGMRRCPIS